MFIKISIFIRFLVLLTQERDVLTIRKYTLTVVENVFGFSKWFSYTTLYLRPRHISAYEKLLFLGSRRRLFTFGPFWPWMLLLKTSQGMSK